MKKLFLIITSTGSHLITEWVLYQKKSFRTINLDIETEVLMLLKRQNKPLFTYLVLNLDCQWYETTFIPKKLGKNRLKQWQFQINELYPDFLESTFYYQQMIDQTIITHFFNRQNLIKVLTTVNEMIKYYKLEIKIKDFVILPRFLNQSFNLKQKGILINLSKNYGWLIRYDKKIIDFFIPTHVGLNSSSDELSLFLTKLLHQHLHLFDESQLIINVDADLKKNRYCDELKVSFSRYPNVKYLNQKDIMMNPINYRDKSDFKQAIRRLIDETFEL